MKECGYERAQRRMYVDIMHVIADGCCGATQIENMVVESGDITG